MIRNTIASLFIAGSPVSGPPAMADLLLASDPTTHSDGSVTWHPPARYDHQFKGKTSIYTMPQKDVAEACRQLYEKAGLDIPVSPTQKGCAAYKGKHGIIISIDKPYRGSTPEAVIRHERGHLNGWGSDHPD